MSTVTGAVAWAGAAEFSVLPREVVVSTGDVASHAWTLTLTTTAASVQFRNRSEDERPLTLVGLTIGDVVVVDGSARTVTVDGVVTPGVVAGGSGWPAIVPGGNDIRVTGASGTLTHRPIYL